MVIERNEYEYKSIPGVDRWYRDKFEIQAGIPYKKEQNFQKFWEKGRNSMPIFSGKNQNDPWTVLTVCGKKTSGKDMKQAVVVWTDIRLRTVWKWYIADEHVTRLDTHLGVQIYAKSWQNIGDSLCTRLKK